MIEDYFREIDRIWKPLGSEPIRLRVIGSTALFLQTNYQRGTKDTDILEIDAITEPVKAALDRISGKQSDLYKRFKMYLEVVAPVIPFLPKQMKVNPLNDLSAQLHHFEIEALDIVDVVVSKLKPFRPSDIDDIRAMIQRDLIDHENLIERFKSAMDRWSLDSRAADFKQYIANLNRVEREMFEVEETVFDLPEWVG